jgi:CHAT domain-containing protein
MHCRQLLLAWVMMLATGASAQTQSQGEINPQLSYRKGDQLFHERRWVEAEPLLRKALQDIDQGSLSPSYLSGCLESLIQIDEQTDRPADALAMARRLYAFLQQRTDYATPQTRALAVQAAAVRVAGFAEACGDAAEAETAIGQALVIPAGQRLVDLAWEPQLLARHARLAQQRGAATEAQARWNAARDLAQAVIKQVANGRLAAKYDVPCVQVLVNYLLAQNKPSEAAVLMTQLGQRQIGRNEPAARVRTLAQSASLYIRANDLEQARPQIQTALELEQQLEPDSPREAELHEELAAILEKQGRHKDAQDHWAKAADLFEINLKKIPNQDSRQRIGILKQLLTAYQERGIASKTIDTAGLLVDELKRAHPNAPARYQAESALGMQYAQQGFYEAAEPHLKAACDYWNNYQPPVPEELANALNNLAVIDQAVGREEVALERFQRAFEIRAAHLASGDLRLAESLNNLAGVHSAAGHYALAIELYQQAVGIARRAGPVGNRVLSNSLLNLSMAFKSQGLLSEAAATCKESLELCLRANSPDALALVVHYDAQAGISLLQDKLDDARHAAERAMEICRVQGRQNELLTRPAVEQLAMIAFRQRDYDHAEALWHQALAIAEKFGQKAVRGRILTFLAKIMVCKSQPNEAERLYREALVLQEQDQRFPTLHYVALCGLAQILHDRGETEQAQELVRKAVELIEVPRAGVYGGESERADFFAQYESAFDLLVDWHLERHQIAEAVAFAERGRNRTFLDELQLAGVNLLDTLEGATGKALKQQEAELRKNANSAMNRVRTASQANDIAQRNQELSEAQRQYVAVWKDIRNASPFYRDLLARKLDVGSLPMLRQKLLNPGNLMLFYYLGDEHGYLLVLGAAPDDANVYNLEIADAAAKLLGVPPGPLNRKAAVKLVADYVAALQKKERVRSATIASEADALRDTSPENYDDRGLSGTATSIKGADLGHAGPVLAEILLPSNVRQAILERHPDHVIIVPDGALHQLPFEALTIEDGPPEKYLLDVFPPITYAPSATILANLLERPQPAEMVNTSILTVGNPSYHTFVKTTTAPNLVGAAVYTALNDGLKPLPGTAEEVRRVTAAFSQQVVKRLEAEAATESNVRATIERCRFVHLAAHGLLDSKHDNLFGAIALTPPVDGVESPENDGLLSLHEIYALNLRHCELAVLSACQTNVGTERPLEAGSTLARAFLAAGTRRVICSHWNVDDRSTAELMGTFFEQLSQQNHAGGDVAYAFALQSAQKKVRNHPEWSSPYYWAPFVLIGPAH